MFYIINLKLDNFGFPASENIYTCFHGQDAHAPPPYYEIAWIALSPTTRLRPTARNATSTLLICER